MGWGCYTAFMGSIISTADYVRSEKVTIIYKTDNARYYSYILMLAWDGNALPPL